MLGPRLGRQCDSEFSWSAVNPVFGTYESLEGLEVKTRKGPYLKIKYVQWNYSGSSFKKL